MYKIKLFHNMSGLVAGQSFKQIITNRDWWKGVFGNMFSTMLGIALTVGVAALVEYHNDKKLSREMMFNIVKVCEDNGKIVAGYDSTFQSQANAIDKMIDIYYQTDKFKNTTKVQDDTLHMCFKKIGNFGTIFASHAQIDRYFYSAQMMHQFGNAEVYSAFANFVQGDQFAFTKIDKLANMWLELTNNNYKGQRKGKNTKECFAELIEQDKLVDYEYQIHTAYLSSFSQFYKDYINTLLQEMGATKQEFEEYKQSINTGVNNNHNYEENI